MADRKRRGSQDKHADEDSQSIFDLFEPAPEKGTDTFGKIPVIKAGEEAEVANGASQAEVKASADAEAAGLQHWTAPPTGQIPAVLGADEKVGLWGNVAGPSWQGGETTWTGPDLSDVFAEPESVDNSAGGVNEPEEDGAYRSAEPPQRSARPAAPATQTDHTQRSSPTPPVPRGQPERPAPPVRPQSRSTASAPQPQPDQRTVLGGTEPVIPRVQPVQRHPNPAPRSRPTRDPDTPTNELWSDDADNSQPQEMQAPPPARQPSPQSVEGQGAAAASGRSPHRDESRRPSDRGPLFDGSGQAQGSRPSALEGTSSFEQGARQAASGGVGHGHRPQEQELPGRSPNLQRTAQQESPQQGRVETGPESYTSGLDSDDSGRDLPKAIAVGVGLAVLVIGAMILGSQAMLVLVSVVALLAVLELFNAMRLAGLRPATLLGAVGTVAVPAAAFYRGDAAFPLIVGLAVIFSALWYLVGADFERPVLNMSLTLKGIFWIGGLAGFAGLILREPGGMELLAATIAITVASDTVAYVGGKSFGSKPLHHVSPNKTWEGTLFGLAAAVFVGLALGLTQVGTIWDPDILAAVSLGLIVGVLAPIGDLAESLVKRDLGVKDMGTLLPGHGGILDRVDGLLFALPGAYYLALVQGLFG